ncbi:hypothetical protein [Streptomyces sp. Tue6028]|uniref:hypothetical protein n=1 Tax=Streptomyces sp. Tue6028 TaxID=2036037 RepID=UPI003D71BEB5
MTQTSTAGPGTPSQSEPSWGGPGRARRVLRAVAVVSCVPYLSLKTAWVAGSRIGIPDGSSLLDHRVGMAVANGLSVLLDSAVIVLALLLTRPWGLRVPAWLLAFPMWVATGLLTPIMTGYPMQLLVRLLGGSGREPASPGREPFLDEWVFGVVYTGFIVQGLTLGTLFVLYARDRWAHLWRGRVQELTTGPVGAARRATAVAAAVLALFPLTTHLMWACGGTSGLSAGRIADRSGDFRVLEAMYVVYLLCAVAGAWMLAFRRGRDLPVAVPLALGWAGSGAVACWGGWMSLAGLGGGDDVADRPTGLMNLTYSVQMIVGVLVVTLGAYFFAERSAAAGAPRRTT